MENVGWIYRWLPAAMYLAFLPICTALIQGQDSILLLLLFVGAFLCLYNGRDFCSRFFGGSRTLTFQLVGARCGAFSTVGALAIPGWILRRGDRGGHSISLANRPFTSLDISTFTNN
jgi:hypothetical protein